jgi:DNA-binding beta-propeller fold protein YncE
MIVSTFAGEGIIFNMPYSVFSGNDGELYVVDTYNHAIRVLDENGDVLQTIGGGASGHRDGAFEYALFDRPTDGVMDKEGRIFIVDSGNHAIRMLHDGYVYTLIGGEAGGRNGHLTYARFNRPSAIAIDRNGNLYVVDTLNHAVRFINLTTGHVSTIAGRLGQEGERNGVRVQALFSNPMGITISPDGRRIYIADTGNHSVRVLEGMRVETVAEGFLLPMGLQWHNNLLMVTDTGNHLIRAISRYGEVMTIAGTGYPGTQNSIALEAEFHFPRAIYNWNGRLLVVDSGNNMIRVLDIEF